MINKIYKRIHNKYSSIFKFFFFLRHVFIIFLISTVLFFSVPKFFDYEKKNEIIKKYLIDYYGLEMVDYKKIANTYLKKKKNFKNLEYLLCINL